jgi:hypothetical protein
MKHGVHTQERQLAAILRTRDGLITRSEALELGLSAADIHGYLHREAWQRVYRNVYRSSTAPATPRQLLRAACLAGGDSAVASHASAAWLWNMVDRAAKTPDITVPIAVVRSLAGVRVHRSRDLDHSRTIVRAGIPATDPLRTLIDLGAVTTAPVLSNAIDRALAARLLTLDGIIAELARLSRQGRPGVKPLREVIAERGFVGAPHPSVLESRMLRLLDEYHLPAPRREIIVGPNGEYRLDFAYPEIKLAIEVDGYVWHFTPEQQRRDHRRRNRLINDGWRILVFTWMDVTQRPQEVAAAIHAARAR